MLNAQLDPQWNDLIDGGALARLDAAPFLRRCRSGQTTREEMREFVKQQYGYARHFTRYLCALLANIAVESDRLELTENLLEEIGFGEDGSLPHSEIYRRMMKRMGVDPHTVEPNPATQRLVTLMMEACRDPNPLVGLGALCLGAEAIVPHVYSQIVAGFRAAGEAEENLEFFHIHIHCDDEHAITMRRIIERYLAEDPRQAMTLRRSAVRLLDARTDFFAALGEPPVEVKIPRMIQGGVCHESIHI
jgi:pyrroloquinoline quinone (PQQ) biosynthesis protein C